MNRKRYYILFITIFCLFGYLAFRLFYLQVFDAGKLARAASAQRIVSTGIERPRGEILDRNGIPFTDRSKKYSVVLKPAFFENDTGSLERVCGILGIDFENTRKELSVRRKPVVIDTDEGKRDALVSLKLDWVSLLYSLKRYDTGSLARHVVGYINRKDQIGQSGIERFYDDILRENTVNTVGIVTDAGNNLVKGLGYRINKDEGTGMLDVKLTLDYHIQSIVEAAMSRSGITGAVVVEDVNTGDIAAMASKPDFLQDNVEGYLQSPNNELFNRATASYNLGSVFKIIDTAALLESPGIPLENYYCPGYIDIGSNIFKCSSYDEGGHGEVDLTRAFAESCNSYFIYMSEKIGYRPLIEMAQKFGLGSTTGIKGQGIGESAGNLPAAGSYYSEGDIANLSIGQGVLMATPLQAADIAATIANGGIKNRINIVDSIIDSKGNNVREVKTEEGHRIVSKETADAIKGLMEAVTEYGTGTAASLDEYGGAAGKTGSAETGKKDVVHAWFVGYFPLKQPRYAVSVLVENGQYGGRAAAPVFAEIAQEIMRKNL